MTDLILDNISDLRAAPLAHRAAWRIAFASANAGMFHQLYINGRLADATQDPAQRSFIVPDSQGPRQVVVAAVARELAWMDLSGQLPADVRWPAWVYRTWVARRPECVTGTRALLLDDHARGKIDPMPVAAAVLWPPGAPRWSFGEDAFGAGGLGYGGIGAPGLGKGAFGAGLFGIDEMIVHLAAALAETGRHRLAIRLLDPHGRAIDLPAEVFDVVLPA